MSYQRFAAQPCSSYLSTITSRTLSLRPGCPSSVSPATSHEMPSSFTTPHTVEFCETDMAGIVHFSNFYRWLEQAEHAFLRSVGLTVSDHLDDGSSIGFPRVSASCRFLSPAKFEDRLTVELRVQRIGVKSLTYDVLFSIDERPVAKGVLMMMYVRTVLIGLCNYTRSKLLTVATRYSGSSTPNIK